MVEDAKFLLADNKDFNKTVRDVQAELNLRWVNNSEGTFHRAEAHLLHNANTDQKPLYILCATHENDPYCGQRRS